MIRVANIIEDGRLAGPQLRIAAVAKRLYGKNVDTTVVYPELYSDDFRKILDEQKIKNVPLRLHRLTRSRKELIEYVVYFFWEIFLLYRFFRDKKFHIIHCSGGAWQFKGVIAGRLARSKVIWHLNDTSMPTFIRFVFKPLAKYFANGFIVAGKRVRRYYIDELNVRKPAYEIQAPVDAGYYDPAIVKRDEKIDSYDGIKIAVVGNINPLKGLEYFMEMAHILNGKHDDLRFFVVGPVYDSQRNYFGKLNALVDRYKLNNLTFYGQSTDVRQVLNSADIYVCASIAEASPMAVWEAMAMEKAIVSTDVGDVNRFIKDGVSGYVVPAKDAQRLADGVERFVADPDLRRSCGTKARETVKQHLDIGICVNSHLNAYKHLLGSDNV